MFPTSYDSRAAVAPPDSSCTLIASMQIMSPGRFFHEHKRRHTL